MRFLWIGALVATSVSAQSPTEVQEYNSLVRQYQAVRSNLTSAEQLKYDRLLREARPSPSASRERVGQLSTNPYLPGSTSGVGSAYSPTSPANRYGAYGSPYSTDGARNKYTTGGLDVVGADGQYLGKL